MRSPAGSAQLTSARSSAATGTSAAAASSAARRRRFIGSPMPKTRLAASVGRVARLPQPEHQRPRLDVEQPEAPRREQELIARAAREAGELQALEGAVEAPLRRQRPLAGEQRGLRARAVGAGAVGLERRGPAARLVAAARAELDALERRAAPPGPTACGRPSIAAHGSSASSGDR